MRIAGGEYKPNMNGLLVCIGLNERTELNDIPYN